MNLRIISKNHAADLKKGFFTKSILEPYSRAAARPTAWELGIQASEWELRQCQKGAFRMDQKRKFFLRSWHRKIKAGYFWQILDFNYEFLKDQSNLVKISFPAKLYSKIETQNVRLNRTPSDNTHWAFREVHVRSEFWVRFDFTLLYEKYEKHM